MKQAILAFLKRPTTIVGIITALMFQIIFSVVWMTGYDGVTDRINKLHVGIVNADGQAAAAIATNLQQSVPFQTSVYDNEQAAQDALNEKDVQMVIVIPEGFAANLQAPDKQASLQFTINEANASMIKSVMQSAAERISGEVNKQAMAGGTEALLASLNMPADQAKAAAAALSDKIKADIVSANKVDGMNNQMVPMMLVLASYVGAMIMGMNVEQSSMFLSAQLSRWKRFGARVIINAAAAVFVSGVGVILLAALGGQAEHGFLMLWAYQILTVLVFMFVSQMFLFLFGMAGMLFNILTLSLQLVTSGAMMPRELLPSFYHHLGDVFPATYAVQGMMDILFGGPAAGRPALQLAAIGAAALLISAGAVAARKDRSAASAVVAANAQTAAVSSHKA
ncbi:YhgE/Pip domain-containing protein [Paenibacillus kobensis]|uniref:YhgE/Pip domain-containing protein n=1 Tax=Paenibacillus kobensis TaxID=59841 RepID=UPI000FD78C57|nr:ABC transporter permease [Paenibacillus kobensis]